MLQDATIYDLLIIGPSDTEEFFIYIKHAIERFNTGIGKEKRITVVGQSLNDLIFAESGGESGVLVRDQIAGKFDMVVAVFWKKYDSLAEVPYLGTAEEIKLVLESGRQIFTYFLNKEISVSEQNPEDLKKIMDFQEQYHEMGGISIRVRDERELEERFLTDLQLYFLKLGENRDGTLQPNNMNDDLLFSQKGLYFLPYGCIGRDKKIQELEVIFAECERPVVIKGVAGVGKTAFCSYYYQLRNSDNHKFSMLFVNLENCMSKADFIHAVCEALRIKEAFMNLNNILEQIRGAERHYDAFYFDNWEDFQCKTLGSADFQCVYKFVNTLACNGYNILISSQARTPSGWREIRMDVLEPDDGRYLFAELLKRRGKDINQMSAREKEAFETLLVCMENHPLTMVLTSSLIEDPNDTLERIKNKWSEVCDQSESQRHRSMEIALKMSYDAVSTTPGAVTLWGLIAELSVDFPSYFIDALEQISSKTAWDDARSALSNRSLVQFSENASSLHMLMPVKAQWEQLAGKKEKKKCFALWARLIEHVAMQSDTSEYTHDPELSNSIRGIVLDCMRSFMMITEFLIQDGQIKAAEKCINAMQDYYESLSDSAFEFLDNLPLDKFSLVTKGMVIKCKGDICRLGRKEEPNIADGYYQDALACFEESGDNVWRAQVMNVIGKNMFWSFHDAPKALDWQIKSEKLSRDVLYSRGIAEAKKDQAIILTEEYNQYDEANRYLEEACFLYKELGDYRGIAHTLKRQGAIMWMSGNFYGAVEKYEEALEFYERAHYIQGQGDTLSRMCIGYIELGETVKLQETVASGERLMDKIPYQMIKSELADSIKKGRNWLQGQELNQDNEESGAFSTG